MLERPTAGASVMHQSAQAVMRDKQVCNNRVKQCEKDWLAGSIVRFVRDFFKETSDQCPPGVR